MVTLGKDGKPDEPSGSRQMAAPAVPARRLSSHGFAPNARGTLVDADIRSGVAVVASHALHVCRLRVGGALAVEVSAQRKRLVVSESFGGRAAVCRISIVAHCSTASHAIQPPWCTWEHSGLGAEMEHQKRNPEPGVPT